MKTQKVSSTFVHIARLRIITLVSILSLFRCEAAETFGLRYQYIAYHGPPDEAANLGVSWKGEHKKPAAAGPELGYMSVTVLVTGAV